MGRIKQKMHNSYFTIRNSGKSFGFTLIELLVVISIIGILATLVAANLNSARSRARDANRKSDLRNISTALRLYFNDKGVYPDPATLPWGSEWTGTGGSPVYMIKLPIDPLPGQNYKYELGATGDTFILTACLENGSDAQGVTTVNTAYDILCASSHWMFQVKQ